MNATHSSDEGGFYQNRYFQRVAAVDLYATTDQMEPVQYGYSSPPVSQRVKSYAPSPKHLFKRNLLLARDTKYIQEKGTLNAKHRRLGVLGGGGAGGHSFLPSGWLLELTLKDLQEQSSSFLPGNSVLVLFLRRQGRPWTSTGGYAAKSGKG